MRNLMTGVVLLVTAVIVVSTNARAEPPTKTPPLMQRKLAYSQRILAGLATDDFDAIARSARAMTDLTDEQWRRDDTPEYRAQLKNFRFITEELARFATEKNLDGATLTYVQLTLSCVSCHKHLRKE